MRPDASSSTVPWPHPARSWRVRAWIRAGSVLGLGLAAWAQVHGLRDVPDGRPSSSDVLGALWLPSSLAALSWFFAFRPRVSVTPAGELRVRGPLTTRTLCATDVVDVTIDPWGLVLHLRDATTCRSIVFQDTASFGEPRWFDVAEILIGHRPVLGPDEDTGRGPSRWRRL